MTTIEVLDIMVAKDGVFRSLRGGAVAKDGFKPVVPGSGVFKGGNWYVLKNNYFLSLTVSVINSDAGGGNYPLGMGSVGGGWLVQSKPSWVTLYKQNTNPLLSEEINEGMEGATYFTASIASNTNTSMRNGTVVFVHAEDSTVTASLTITQAAAAPEPEPEPVSEYLFKMYFTGQPNANGYNVTNCEVELRDKNSNALVQAIETIECGVIPTNGKMRVNLPSGNSSYSYSNLGGDLDPNHAEWGADIQPGSSYPSGTFYWELYWMNNLVQSGVN
jgi:hypothetical protein